MNHTAPRGLSWLGELSLGFRLAISGGRSAWVRLILSTIAIGLASFVLFVGGSVQHVIADENARLNALVPVTDPPPHSHIAPLQSVVNSMVDFQNNEISDTYVRATGPTSPVPPGLSRVPGPGEMFVSPAVARLLASPAGNQLRPLLPAHVVGTIGDAGLEGPQDLAFVAGFAPNLIGPWTFVQNVYGWGDSGSTLVSLWLIPLLVVSAAALLMPIPVMILVSSRIAEAERERRLAAIRLIGAGSKQVRRIAAAESLVPSITGLAIGAILFTIFRRMVPDFTLFGYSAFRSDVAIPLPLVLLIIALVPVLAVGAALFALRRTAIEPLGVVRRGRPIRRRLWWRLTLIALGVAAFLKAARDHTSGPLWTYELTFGACALLIGVPALLPYLVERITNAARGGPPAWQLAIRRLQMDGGSAARVVSGVAVVLTGAIALQTILTAAAHEVHLPPPTPTTGFYYVLADSGVRDHLDTAIQRTGVAREWYPVTTVGTILGDEYNPDIFGIMSCAAIERLSTVTTCHDGDAFATTMISPALKPGAKVRIAATTTPGQTTPQLFGTWRLPAHIRDLPPSHSGISPPGVLEILVTPGALAGVALPAESETMTMIWTDPRDRTADTRLREAIADQPMRAALLSEESTVYLNPEQRYYVAIRTGLLIGSLFTLSLAGITMLVLALEQVRERRRPLAMLVAAGVPRSVLARSLLWQVALPVAISVVTAVATGILLAVLVLRLSATHVVLDWATIMTFSGVAVALVLLVTVATLPALRGATRLSAHRME